MDDSGFNPNIHYKDPDDLKKLKITTKKDLKENPVEDFINEGARTKIMFTDSTSGSTGIPLKVHRNSIERKYQIAKWLRVLFLNGYNPFQKVVSLSPPSRLSEGKSFIQKFGLFRRKPVDFLLDVKEMATEIIKVKPNVIYGNRSHFDLLANYFVANSINLESIKLILVGGEIIRESNLELYRKAFHINTTQIYGSAEMGIIAFNLKNENGMVINDDLTHFRFLDKNYKDVDENIKANIILTNLTENYMPIINYNQGDQVIYKIHKNKKRITQIFGRDDDTILFPDGTEKTYHTIIDIFYSYKGIKQFRFTQKKIDEIFIEFECDIDYYNSVKEIIIKELSHKVNSQIKYDIVQREKILPDETGKTKRFVSYLKGP
jgi:phenylacetate-coenzyme A ligase PaaK-like adenylate-forming protein